MSWSVDKLLARPVHRLMKVRGSSPSTVRSYVALIRAGLRTISLGLLLLLAASVPAQAHKPSDSYLTLTVAGGAISGRWDIALRDLDFAMGLDANGDGEITWGELRARHGDIASYSLARLGIATTDGKRCDLHPIFHLLRM